MECVYQSDKISDLKWLPDRDGELIFIRDRKLLRISTVEYVDVLSKLKEHQNQPLCKFPPGLLPIIASYCIA